MQSVVEDLGCTALALNGVEDHTHLLVAIPSIIEVARLMKQVKGVSSHFVNQTLRSPSPFKWQSGYGAFSVSRWDVEMIIGYIRRQKEHHGSAELRQELEAIDTDQSESSPGDRGRVSGALRAGRRPARTPEPPVEAGGRPKAPPTRLQSPGKLPNDDA